MSIWRAGRRQATTASPSCMPRWPRSPMAMRKGGRGFLELVHPLCLMWSRPLTLLLVLQVLLPAALRLHQRPQVESNEGAAKRFNLFFIFLFPLLLFLLSLHLLTLSFIFFLHHALLIALLFSPSFSNCSSSLLPLSSMLPPCPIQSLPSPSFPLPLPLLLHLFLNSFLS